MVTSSFLKEPFRNVNGLSALLAPLPLDMPLVFTLGGRRICRDQIRCQFARQSAVQVNHPALLTEYCETLALKNAEIEEMLIMRPPRFPLISRAAIPS